MVFGAINIHGQVLLEFIDKNLNSEKYIILIKKKLLPILYNLYNGNNFFIIQDNAPCYVSKKTLEFLDENEVHYLDWPAHSADLNPIENVWALLSQKVYQFNRKFTKKSSLKEQIIFEWNNLNKEIFSNLVNSFDNRLSQVIERNGKLTDY